MVFGMDNTGKIIRYCFTPLKKLSLKMGFGLPTLDPSMFAQRLPTQTLVLGRAVYPSL